MTSAKTETLNAATRASIIHLCIAAHQEEDFKNLVAYVPAGGLHFLAYRDKQLVSHALVTTRWLQPERGPVLRTAYVDAVATLPIYQGQGYGSTLMRNVGQPTPLLITGQVHLQSQQAFPDENKMVSRRHRC